MQPSLRLAYITTSYPALSHTFIEREVAALRRLGVEIHTISLRRTSGEALLSPENRHASQTTYAVRPPRWREVLGFKGRLWQVFYFGEAILVWHHCVALEVRHIHAHHGSPPADVALLAAHFGSGAGRGPRTWSLTLHGYTELWDVRWFRLAEKVRRAAGVVCVSDFTRSQLMVLVGDRHWDKLRVVHCGVSPSEYKHLGKPQTVRPQVLCVGRLVPEKGQPVLLKALALLTQKGFDVEVVLVGSGPLRAKLERLALDLGVADRVIFRGAVRHDEIARCYATASLCCSPSLVEGVPVVLMEAMACGRPVVATAVAGVRELVRDRDTGLLVTPGRPEELSDAIATLLRRPQLRSRLARDGRQHVLREFDVDRSAGYLEALFSEIIEPDRQRSGERVGGGCASSKALAFHPKKTKTSMEKGLDTPEPTVVARSI
jgi:colanic acid/amylovoran biosynthesis glycosyltransferase